MPLKQHTRLLKNRSGGTHIRNNKPSVRNSAPPPFTTNQTQCIPPQSQEGSQTAAQHPSSCTKSPSACLALPYTPMPASTGALPDSLGQAGVRGPVCRAQLDGQNWTDKRRIQALLCVHNSPLALGVDTRALTHGQHVFDHFLVRTCPILQSKHTSTADVAPSVFLAA